MCEVCWKEYGSPRIMNDKVIYANILIMKLDDLIAGSGCCHAIIDDFNIDDKDMIINHSPAWCCEERKIVEVEFLEYFKTLSIQERASAIALNDDYYGIKASTDKTP